VFYIVCSCPEFEMTHIRLWRDAGIVFLDSVMIARKPHWTAQQRSLPDRIIKTTTIGRAGYLGDSCFQECIVASIFRSTGVILIFCHGDLSSKTVLWMSCLEIWLLAGVENMSIDLHNPTVSHSFAQITSHDLRLRDLSTDNMESGTKSLY
jgi:hypothetical protein